MNFVLFIYTVLAPVALFCTESQNFLSSSRENHFALHIIITISTPIQKYYKTQIHNDFDEPNDNRKHSRNNLMSEQEMNE